MIFINLSSVSAVVACQAVANIVKSSLGPVGLDKVYFLFLNGMGGGLFLLFFMKKCDCFAVVLQFACFKMQWELGSWNWGCGRFV